MQVENLKSPPECSRQHHSSSSRQVDAATLFTFPHCPLFVLPTFAAYSEAAAAAERQFVIHLSLCSIESFMTLAAAAAAHSMAVAEMNEFDCGSSSSSKLLRDGKTLFSSSACLFGILFVQSEIWAQRE